MNDPAEPARGSVLVVDDDFMVARIHTQFVERTPGFRVVGVASSGEAALADIARLRPDLVLLDVHLPDMTGIEVLRRLRADGDDVGVLVVTAAREADTVRAAASGGAVHYLVKPFDYDDLRVRLESFRSAHLALSGPAAPGQQDIDAVFGVAVPAPAVTLPKGLSPQTADLVANHLVEVILDQKQAAGLGDPNLVGRAMVVRRAERVDIECVVRGYLAGSAWDEYRRTGDVCGIRLPAGLREADRLPEPIFTPATKAETGHDENISFEQMASLVGEGLARQLKDLSLKLYSRAAQVAEGRGIIIADTKFEFGLLDGQIIVIDELLTPDSSRFWDAALYQPGRSQPSFDKQYVRDWLIQSGWNREPPAPPLPEDVVAGTVSRYLEAYSRLTGKDLLAELGLA